MIIEDTIKNYTFNANDITYFKNEEKIITKGTTKADINSKYIFKSRDVIYFRNQSRVKSKAKTEIIDQNSQIYFVDEFDYSITESLLKGVNILIITNYQKPKSDKFFSLVA